MRWEVFYNERNHTLTVIDAPEGHEFTPPENVGASIGSLSSEPGKRFIVSSGNTLLKTWVTNRFAFLGIEDTIERWHHLPML